MGGRGRRHQCRPHGPRAASAAGADASTAPEFPAADAESRNHRGHVKPESDASANADPAGATDSSH